MAPSPGSFRPAFFGQKVVAETTSDYRGGSVAAFLGGYELDLTKADITNGPAIIDVFTIWGGIEIYVPDTWEVIGEVTPIMGGFEMKTSGSDPRKRLIVRGLALMAGIEVKRRS
jgi:predicted membrane protein